MSNSFRREAFNYNDAQNAMSYISDIGCKALVATGEARIRFLFDNTVAVGNGTTYQYPHAMFAGGKQVYPPICASYVTSLLGLEGNGAFRLENSYSFSNIGEYTYIFKNMFHVTYATGMSNTYSHTYVPSFDISEQDGSTKFAYFGGGSIIIKDPTLTKKIPNHDYIEWGSNYNSDYYTFFKVQIDTRVEGAPNVLKSTYNTTYYPLSTSWNYNVANKAVIRRQFELDSDNTTFITNLITNSGSSTYYIYEYYYNGQLITNTANMASLLPQWGIGAHYYNPNNTGSPYYGGADPNYFINDIFSPNSSYTYFQVAFEQSTTTYATCLRNFPYKKTLFNFFLLKVNGNEDMWDFGLRMKVNSRQRSNGITDTTYDNAITSQVSIATGLSSIQLQAADFCKIVNEETFEKDTNYPVSATSMYSIKNNNTTQIAGGGFRHKSSTWKLAGTKWFTYYAYNTMYNNGNVRPMINSVTLTAVSEQHGNLNVPCTLVQFDQNTSISTTTTYATNGTVGTYTYCYLGANVIYVNGNSTIITNTVLSSTYICIKKVQKTAQSSSTNYITKYPTL